jgi:Flp pilus assembly protein TadG
MKLPHSRQNKKRTRVGAATVEFALCAPVFFFLVFTGMELARTNMIVHSVESAALQGARRGIIPGATSTQCYSAAEAVLKIAGLREYTINVNPSTITELTTSVSVKIDVPLDKNGYLASKIFHGQAISRIKTLNREE